MNKFAIAIAALSLSAGAAFAENPSLGRTDVQPSAVDQSTTASIKSGNGYAVQSASNQDTSSRARYGDGAPYAAR
ncbi:hypothetical protein MUO32_17915 [Shinella sp. CPCC 101442]|uniref:hypothetical protein n=1 Tax=Shinella sp. CPCC 101442 TaxID=2932265 RepID=UPI0021530A90|nr:hypothetical protein [Shinella sp. CPCC 101442]MCR6500918.1 hypothetical protein [Shinella sp. CPCC 101442]